MSPVYTVESIGYLDPKISEHRHIFLDLFRQRKTALRTPYLGALSSVDRGSVLDCGPYFLNISIDFSSM